MKYSFVLTLITLILLGGGCVDSRISMGISDFTESGLLSTAMDLSGAELESVPGNVFDRADLTELDISNNSLSGSLPSEIGKLRNLRVLNASHNQMTGVPAELGQLSKLEVLDLSNNFLTGLPAELGNLKNLKTLDLRGNKVSEMDLAGIRAKLTGTSILE